MITKFFEYFKWNEDMTEKIIDLGELYDQQDGDISNMTRILEYEMRKPSDFKDEKCCTLHCKIDDKIRKLLTGGFIRCVNNGIYIDKDPLGNNIFLHSPEFKYWYIKITYGERKFTKEDPYGEEEWD